MEKDYIHDFSDPESNLRLQQSSKEQFGNLTHLPIGIWVVGRSSKIRLGRTLA